MVETRRRKFRRRRRDVGELCILHERVPLHEVLSEGFDQDVVGAELAESLVVLLVNEIRALVARQIDLLDRVRNEASLQRESALD